MSIVTMKEILQPARREGYAIGAFEFWSFDSARAIISAAEKFDMPVILQTGPIECEYAGIENLSTIAHKLAEQSSVPVALHLDHGDTVELACRAIDAGFTSVMIDASALSFEENVSVTQEVVGIARKYGVTVESELGRIGGSEALQDVSEEDACQTDPKEAAEFIRLTGIDALAVGIGSVHGFYKKTPNLNIPRLKKIAELVDIPLVLHGGTGIGEEMLVSAIENGISKVNICTEFLAAFGKTFIKTQNTPGFKYSIPGLYIPSRQAGQAVAEEKIRIFSRK